MDKLVTLGGECFEAEFEAKQVAPDRDGVYYAWNSLRHSGIGVKIPRVDKLVTLGGECFEAEFEAKQVAPDRDGVYYAL